jgi:PAS domain S-box-containing protein
MREVAVHSLATEIRNNLDSLASAYELRLREISDYAGISDDARLEAARDLLQLVANSVEAQDHDLFTQFVQSVAVERMAQGFEMESVQRALDGLAQILEPRLSNVETANFLWRTVAQAQVALSQVAMARLRAAQGSQQALIDSMPFGVVIIGRDKRIRRANRAALASMGYESEGQVTGLLCHHTMCPAEANRCPILDLGHGVDRSERVVVAQDGRRIPILKSVVPVTFDGEEVLLEAFLDITERREAQEEIRRLVRALEASHDAIAITDVDGPIRFVNSAFEQLTGYSLDEAMGQGVSVLESDLYPDEFYAGMWQIILSGQVWRGEITNQRKDGTTYEAQLTISPVRNDAGQIDQFIAIQRDVTQRKQLERQIQESLERRGSQVQTSTEIAQEIAGAPALGELYQGVVTLVKERFGYYHAQLFLLDEDRDRLVTVAGYGEVGRQLVDQGHHIPLGQGVVGRAGARGQPILSPDVSQDPEWLYLPLLPDTRGELAVPVRLGDRVLGVLDVQSDQAGALSDDDRLLLEGLSGQIATAIESTRLRQETEEHLRELERLTRAMSREGWESFRREAGSVGYLFDQTDIVSDADLWHPEIGLASERQAFVPPGSNGHDVAVAPLSVRGGEFIGVLGVQDDPTAPLSPEDLALVESVSEQVAQALESARLFEETQKRLQRLAMLSDVSQKLASAPLEAEEIAEVIVHQLMEALDVPEASISLLEPETGMMLVIADTQVEEATSPIPGTSTDYRLTDYPATLRVMQNLQPLVVHANDLEADPAEVAYMREYGRASLAILPLAVKGQAIGVVELESWDQELHFTPEELDLATTLANQAAAVLENARLLDATRHQVKDLTMLAEVSQALASAPLHAAEVAEIIANQFVVVMGISEASISLLSPDGETMEIVADLYSDGEGVRALYLEERFSLAEYPGTARVMETLEPLIVQASDPDADRGELAYIRDFGTETLAIFPLVVKGQAIGVLELEVHGRERHFSPQELSTMKTLVNQAAVALENALLFEQTQAALAEVEATHRSYLRQTWQEYLHRRDLLERGALLYDRSQGEVAAPMHGDAMAASALWRSEIEDAVANGGPVTVESVDDEGTRTSLAVPVVLRGQTLGVLGVEAPLSERQWTEDEIALIEAVGEQLAQTLETTRLFEETSRRAEQMSTLNQVGLDLTSGLELELVLQMLYEHCTEVFVTDTFYVALYDEDTGMIRFPLVTGVDGPVELAPLNIRHESGLTGYVIRTGQTLHIPDTHAMPEDAPYHALPISDLPNRCYIGVPLTSRGQVMGVLSIQSRTPQAYTSEDVDLLTTLATQASIAIENARAYERLVETADQLREVDRFKTQFLANMSHELRTPLNSIIGFSRVMLKGIDGPLTDLQEADLTSIYNSGQHLLSLLNSILDMSKIEAGKMDLAFEEVAMPEILDATLSVAKALVKGKPIELKAMVPDDLPTVWADAQRIRQVVLNLLSNAAKFTDEGSIVLRAEVDTEADGQHPRVVISVSDTGIGIDPEAQKLLFIPFQQVDGSTTRRAEGTGLGLAISRSFIDLHGGDIWVESEPGKGSTFAFTLPIYKTAPERGNRTRLDLDPNRKTVLAIDDDAGVIILLKRYLENDGYQVVGVTESLRAVEMAQRLAPDLTAITLDVAMRDLDGWQILEALKSDPETQTIPIVLISIVDDVARGAELGAAACLRKPVTRDEVLHALRKVENGCR